MNFDGGFIFLFVYLTDLYMITPGERMHLLFDFVRRL